LLSASAVHTPLHDVLFGADTALLSRDERVTALDTFLTTPSGRQRPSRFWRVDLDTIAPDAAAIVPNAVTVRIENGSPRAIACDLATAARDHVALLQRVFGASGVAGTKFGSLTRAFAGDGVFVYVPKDADASQPIVITYDVAAGAVAFPYTVVLAERGARVTVLERFTGARDAFVCAAVEAVSGEGSEVHCASHQALDGGARWFSTRSARPGRDAQFSWTTAELGADLSVVDLAVTIDEPGIDATMTSLFFPTGSQHVDIVSTADHRTGDATSQTHVKSAAAGSGQARYLGTIRIAPHAQGSDASLRDDALLLSKRAHIDSVPALEIGANDVKAYHGATVGALDDEQIFYLESRGIAREAAERTIALGFFEPAIDRFPTEALRDELRDSLAEKIS
jgi:Fe-S cluster assembly protein SufD